VSVSGWLQERIRYRGAMGFLRHKEVPHHRFAVTYYTGGITLFFFLVQVLTGLLLLMYYRPTADAAFESVRFIMSKVRFGWLVRQIHVWSGSLMILAAALHLLATFFGKAYRRPREVTWLTGVGLLFLTLTFGFTGYLLPWNTLAYFATQVGTEIAGDVPVVGRAIMVLLRGGEDITEATLSRFFGIHVAILPAVTMLVLGLHLLLVQVHGMSRPISVQVRGGEPFYPHFVLRDLFLWVLLLGGVAALATLVPWPLGEKADLLAPAIGLAMIVVRLGCFFAGCCHGLHGKGRADVLERAPLAQLADSRRESILGDGSVDRGPQRPQLAVHGVELAVRHVDLIHGRSVQVDQLDGIRRATGAPADQQGIDLECEESRQGVLLGWSLPGLVVGDHQPAIRGLLHAVEDPADHDAVQVLQHVELAIDRLDLSGVLHREVVGEQRQALQAPGAFLLDGFEQPFELGDPHLGPGLPEQVVEQLRGPFGGGAVVEALQREVRRRPAGLIDRGGLGEPVYRPELEELRAVLEVTGSAR